MEVKFREDEMDDEFEYDDEESVTMTPKKAPMEYDEKEVETATVRCCGAFLCILVLMLALTWVVHAIPVSTITDIPPFARSAIWMSIAHHTDAWQQRQSGTSPPPPAFGDGLGNFPDPER